MNKKIVMWIIGFILLVGTVSALGVTPGRTTTNFEPGTEHDFVLKILNEAGKAQNIAITVEGELKPYVQLNETEFSFGADELERYVSYKLRLPQSFDNPGTHWAKIRVNELPDDLNGDLQIGSLVTVVSQVKVEVPYPDKYLDSNFDVETNGKRATLHVFVNSLGQSDIDDVKGIITVEKDGEEVSRKESDLGGLTKFQRSEMLEIVDLDDGEYSANAIIEYDGKVITHEEDFAVGSLLKALGITVDPKFKLGGIAELNLLLSNQYKYEVKDVSSRLLLKDGNGNTVVDVKGITLNLGSQEQGVAKLYLNTEDLAAGTYTGSLVLSYGNELVERPLNMKISQNNIEVTFGDLTGLAIGTAQTPARTDWGVWMPLLFILVGVVLILIIITNIRLMKILKEKK